MRTMDRFVGRTAMRAMRVGAGSAIVAEAVGGGCGRLEAPGGMTGVILPILGSGWASVAGNGISEMVGSNGAQGTGNR